MTEARVRATVTDDLPDLAKRAGTDRFYFSPDPSSPDGSDGWLHFPDLDQEMVNDALGVSANDRKKIAAAIAAEYESRGAALRADLELAEEAQGVIEYFRDLLIGPMEQRGAILANAMDALKALPDTVRPETLSDHEDRVQGAANDVRHAIEEHRLAAEAAEAHRAEVVAGARARLDEHEAARPPLD